MNRKKLFVIFTEDFYKFYYGINLATTLKSCNNEVEVFFSGYSCNFLKKDWKKYDKKKINNLVISNYNCNLEELFELSSEMNISFFFCQSSLNLFSISNGHLNQASKVKPVALYTIINKYKNQDLVFI